MNSSPKPWEHGEGRVEGWFLGPKAENEQLLTRLVLEAIWKHCEHRRGFHPEDPIYITDEKKASRQYRKAVQNLSTHARELNDRLEKSAPFYSMRYQGHMLWDQALPAMIGYFGAMLYNQNNVAAEASPVTTALEIEASRDLCQMLGYRVADSSKTTALSRGPVSWGHITSCGSVANIEALWAARNAKFFPVALREALHKEAKLRAAKDLKVTLPGSKTSRKLIDLDTWTLLNLTVDEVVDLPYRIQRQYKIETSTTNEVLSNYSVQGIGLNQFYKSIGENIGSPVALVPGTKHYSWPKGGALLGLGDKFIRSIAVDKKARMDVGELRKELEICLSKRMPVIAVIAVIGSTAESAVDPLVEILKLREDFRRRKEGLDFAVHCDAAWGGYFNAMLMKKGFRPLWVPTWPMSEYVNSQYGALRDADSITVDPHKAGYVPYPAGALCYRNSAMRDLVTLKAPVVLHSKNEPSVGVYGIEGSKPGAAAASVWLAHKVIPPTEEGYGKILGQCMWTSKRMYCRLVTLRERDKSPKPRYKIVTFQELPAMPKSLIAQGAKDPLKYIEENFVSRTNEELWEFLEKDKDAKKLFNDLGSDQVILAYSFNFYTANQSNKLELNRDVLKLNKLNKKIFDICSITTPPANLNDTKLILTSSEFDKDSHGKPFLDHYCRRLGVQNPNYSPVTFLISTTMDPWTTDTPKGDFLQVVEDELREAAEKAIKLLGY